MKCEPSLTVKGTLVKVETICKDTTWSSWPVIKGKAAGSLLLSSAIFFPGASPTATLRVLQLMNVQVLTPRMSFSYRSAFLIATVEKCEELRASVQIKKLGLIRCLEFLMMSRCTL